MIDSFDSILVGVSGGADSVSLLHMLKPIAKERSVSLAVAHLNHRLRGLESDKDARFVASVAENLKLPYYEKAVDVQAYRKKHKLSLEEAARQVRYSFFFDIADRYNYHKIALGHHADDNAELVLMNLIRGSGLLGVSGMSAMSRRRIIRPFIGLNKAEIIAFAQHTGLEYRTDASNDDPTFLRNRIRHQLIPTIKEDYNPNITAALNRISDIAAGEEQWIDKILSPIFEGVIRFENDEKIGLDAAALERLHIAARRRLIRKAVSKVKGNLRRITFKHIDNAVDLLSAEKSGKTIHLPEGVDIQRKTDLLFVSKRSRPGRRRNEIHPHGHCPVYEYTIESEGEYTIPEIGGTLRVSIVDAGEFDYDDPNVALFDASMIDFPMVIRSPMPGDRFSPYGMAGSKKVKNLFIDEKIKRENRRRWPLLLHRDEIIWVVGLRRSDKGVVKNFTKEVLKTELFLA